MKKLLICALLAFAAATSTAKAYEDQTDKTEAIEETDDNRMVSQYKNKLTPEQAERVRDIHRRYHKEIVDFAKKTRKKEHDEIFDNVLNDEQRAEYKRVKEEKKQKFAEFAKNRNKKPKIGKKHHSFGSYIKEYQKAKEDFKQSLSDSQRQKIDEINDDFYAKAEKDFKERQKEHREKTKEWREKADNKIAALLNDKQKKQFDNMNEKKKILDTEAEKIFEEHKKSMPSRKKSSAKSDKNFD